MGKQERIAQVLMKDAGFQMLPGETVRGLAANGSYRALSWWKTAGRIMRALRQ